jgi:hypothetical protein
VLPISLQMPSGGCAKLLNGNLADPTHRRFLTDEVDLMFCNNFRDVMNDRSNLMKVDRCVDDHIAALFTQLKPGAKLVTLDPIHQRLAPSIRSMNKIREKNKMQCSDNASFYEIEEVEHPCGVKGVDNFSYSTNPFKFYIYTRIGPATFLCADPSCPHSANPISAFEIKHQGCRDEQLIPVTQCPRHVSCRITRMRMKTWSTPKASRNE